MTTSATYQEILDKLTSTDTVVVMFAGNSGSWADNTYYGELRSSDIGFMTSGSPGTYTNSFTVASVQNDGVVGYSFCIAGADYAYTESATYGNQPLATLAGDGEADYPYDFESERFLVSLLKHEAQHTTDMKQFPGITPAELEYRAKLAELHYSDDLGLLLKFLSEADESKTNDSHAIASARLKLAFVDMDQARLSGVQTRALELLHAHTKEMEEKHGNRKQGPTVAHSLF